MKKRSLTLSLLCQSSRLISLWIAFTLHHLHIAYNSPPLTPKFCITIASNITIIPREAEDNSHATFWRVHVVYYEQCDNDE